MTARFRGNFNVLLKSFDAESLNKMLNSVMVLIQVKMRTENYWSVTFLLRSL